MSDLNPRSTAQRSVKIPHLVFGLLFLGVAGIWALVVSGVITENRLPVLAPAVLIVAGVIGLAASLASTRNHRHELVGQAGAVDPEDGESPADPDDAALDRTQEIH